MAELVSVVIPTRNRAGYLKQAVDSVYAQSWQDFEIIVVNDGDANIDELAQQYDPRFRLVTQDHQGVSVARNRGIAEARGNFIAFLDDDDLFVPEKLQKNMEYFEQHPDVVWLCSGFSFINAKGMSLARPAIIPVKEEITLHDIAMFTFIHTSSVMVRTDHIKAAGGFPEGMKISEDYHTWTRVLMMGRGAALPDCLTYFRQHAGNTDLSWWRLLKANTQVIDLILANRQAGMLHRGAYMGNLHRIIAENLWDKGNYFSYLIFKLLLAVNPQN